MKPYVFSVQYTKSPSLDVLIDRGVTFGNAYVDIVKDIENKKLKNGEAIIDIYVTALENKTISLSEESYDKLLDGETLWYERGAPPVRDWAGGLI